MVNSRCFGFLKLYIYIEKKADNINGEKVFTQQLGSTSYFVLFKFNFSKFHGSFRKQCFCSIYSAAVGRFLFCFIFLKTFI